MRDAKKIKPHKFLELSGEGRWGRVGNRRFRVSIGEIAFKIEILNAIVACNTNLPPYPEPEQVSYSSIPRDPICSVSRI
jgi:hypothetical protein